MPGMSIQPGRVQSSSQIQSYRKQRHRTAHSKQIDTHIEAEEDADGDDLSMGYGDRSLKGCDHVTTGDSTVFKKEI